MHVERLTRLRDLLRADAANPNGVKFDLGSWTAPAIGDGSVAARHYTLVRGKPTKVPTLSCDTFACAFGLAALDPVFQAEGLHFKVHPLDSYNDAAWMIPEYDGVDGMHAGAAFFDISVGDSEYLFDPSSYDNTPHHAEGELFVAQRIDDFINGSIDKSQHPGWRDEGDDED